MRKLSKILALALVMIMVFSMMTVFTFEASAATPSVLYLTPNSNWTKDGARFAAYFFGNGEKWVSMTKNAHGYYEVEVPAGYPNVIFCRMNGSATANNWNNKWNQTGDLTIPTDGKNMFTVPSGAWDGSTSTWSTLTIAHTWINATCAAPKTCSVCKITEGAKLNTHTWNDANCTTPKTCSVCSLTEGEALDHNYVEGSCSRCGGADPDYCTHSSKTEVNTATCTTAGKHYFDCDNCDEIFDETSVDALGHNYVNGVCSRCNLIITYFVNGGKWTKVSAHMWNEGGAGTTWPGIAMTKTGDTVNGFDVYYIESATAYDNIIFNNNDAGSQTANLKLTSGQYYNLSDNTWYGSLDAIPELDPLSTGDFLVGSFNGWNTTLNEFKLDKEGGSTSYVSIELEEGEVIEFKVMFDGAWYGSSTKFTSETASGDFSDSVSGNATLTALCKGTYVFALTNKTLKVTFVSHTPGAAADCENAQVCTKCNTELAKALGHKWVAADCDTPKTCSVCSETEGEALGHTWVDADCDTPKTCSVCSETEGEAIGHDYKAVVTAPTFDAQGYTTHTCANCGDAYVDTYVDALKAVAQIGETKYATLAEALAAANDGEVITLNWAEGDAPIYMNGAVFGKTVTITGTATVDWNKGFLFIGRGGAGNGTVIFENANLVSASNSASYGIHVSGREKDTSNKYDGTLIIKNSTIELDYLINKGTIELDNSVLTVKNGFAIGGRPASETESGEDATATITLDNGSKLVVNRHNGMGLGYEAIGVMNVLGGSAFECTQDFLVTAKGTMNVENGTIKVAGTLANLGNINITDSTVELAKFDNDNLTFLNGEITIRVEDATGSGYAIRVNDGVVFNNSYVKGTTNETVRLLGSATFNGGFECAYLQGSATGVGGTVTIEEGTVVRATYGVEFSADYVLNGGTIELAGGNASGKFWGMIFQNATFEINTNLNVIGNTSTAPIHFTDAIVTINASVKQTNSGGEPLYISADSSVTLTTNALIDVLSVHGTGTLKIDATGMSEGEYANVKCKASGFTGTLELMNNELLVAEINKDSGKIVLVHYHDFISSVVTDPTCTEAGYTTRTCKCGYSEKVDEVAALGHKYEAVVTAPTVDAQGYTTHTCSVCGDSYTDSYVDALKAVATVNGVKYASLAEAIAVGGEVILLDDVVLEDSLVIPAGKVVTLNLDGHTISQSKECTESYSMISNKGTLTITGNGKISFTDTSAGDPKFGWGSYTIHNVGTLVVENGTIEHLGAQSFATHMICAIFQYSGSTTINGGVISTPAYRSARLWKGEMIINGGEFDGQLWVQSVDSTSKLVISGGTFGPNGRDGSSVFVECKSNYTVEFKVTGGNFTTKIGCNDATRLTGDRIVGGSFSAAAVSGTNSALIAEGYVFDENGSVIKEVHEHSYNKVVTAPTCLAEGYTTYTCDCGDEYVSDKVAALGHNIVIDAAVAPTCTETGLTAGEHCSRCDHKVAQEIVAANGHTEEIIPAVAPTCTATGLTEGKKCSVCDTVTVKQTVVDALGHTEVIDAAVAATCTATGLTEGKHCSVCGETLIAQEVVEKAAHTPEDAVVENKVDATCKAEGSYDSVVYCSVCEAELSRESKTIDKLAHTEEIIPAVAATCTATGLTEGKKCSVCNEVLVAQEVVAKAAHTEATVPGKAATCTSTGLTEGKKCSVCNEILVSQQTIGMKAHTEVDIPATAPTCTESGLTAGKKCSVCQTVTVPQTPVSALGHTEEIIPAVAPTCTATGLTEGKKCSVCETVLVAQEEAPKLEHTFVNGECACGEKDPHYTNPTTPNPEDEFETDNIIVKILKLILMIFKAIRAFFGSF